MSENIIKVGMVSLGCPKNQVDAELMLHKLKEAGYQLETEPGLADVVIINTCGFIQAAKEEAIENIDEFLTLKQEGRIKKVIVTGCLAERYADEIAENMPDADVIAGLGCNGNIVEIVNRALEGETLRLKGKKDELPIEGERELYSLPFYAYLKIAEGCDNNCAYCAIPAIRGRFRSRPAKEAAIAPQPFHHTASHSATESAKRNSIAFRSSCRRRTASMNAIERRPTGLSCNSIKYPPARL